MPIAMRYVCYMCYACMSLGTWVHTPKGPAAGDSSQQQALAPYRGCPELPSAPFLRQKEGAAVLG